MSGAAATQSVTGACRARRVALSAGVALAIAAAAVSVYGAWCCRNSTHVDYAVTAVQAKQIAEGRGFPVFYYGQECMGTVESAVSAGVCRIMGVSAFAVCLGTAFLGLLALSVVFIWTKEIAGVIAALAAVAFMTIAPRIYLEYRSCHLSYMVIVLTCTAVLWLAARVSSTWLAERRLRAGDLLLLGLAAGVGWWSSQLVVVALLPAALVMVATIRRGLLGWRILSGAVGFFAGSAPWWVWNLRNDFGSLRLASGLRLSGFRHGLHKMYALSLPEFLGTHGLGWAAKLAVLAPCLLAVGWVVVLGLSGRLRRSGTVRQHSLPSLAVLILVLPVVTLFFSASTFGQGGAVRYLLPLLPCLAVAVGVGTASLFSRIGAAGFLPLALLVGMQVPVLRGAWQFERAMAREHRRAVALGAELRAKNVKAVYVELKDRWLNFALGEEFCFWPLPGLRYRQYWDRIEGADRVAVLNQHLRVESFLRTSGGSCSHIEIEGMHLCYDFRAPQEGLAEVPPSEWQVTPEGSCTGALAAVSDRMWDTAWDAAGGADGGTEGSLEVRLKKPALVTAIRLIFAGPPRGEWMLEGRAPGARAFEPLCGTVICTGFRWSGDRIYWGGEYRLLDCRFDAREIEAFRLTPSQKVKEDPPCRIAEVQAFGPAPAPPGEEESLQALVSCLQKEHFGAVYCDRRLGMALVERSLGATVVAEPYLSDRRDTSFDPAILPGRPTALVVRSEEAPMTKAVLATARLPARTVEVGPWTVICLAGRVRDLRVGRSDCIRWVGVGCLVQNTRRLGVSLGWLADELYSAGETGQALSTMQESLRVLPYNGWAIERLGGWVADAGGSTDMRAILAAHSPDVRAEAAFACGPTLAGVSLDGSRLAAEGVIGVKYFWRVPPTWRSGDQVVFAHFKGPGGMFQDDRPLDLGDVSYQPYPLTFVEERIVHIPAGQAPGEYRLWLGIYRPSSGRRLKCQTALPTEERAVGIPLSVTIGPEKN